MYRDAIDILGVATDMSEQELQKMIRDQLLPGADGKPVGAKKNRELGNFILNNVIDSSRFRYLVRYGNAKKIRETANCAPAVQFVLKGIPDAQIERYYESCRDTGSALVFSYEKKRRYLADLIGSMNFELFKAHEEAQEKSGDRTLRAEARRRNKAIVRLYLTVMYLMLKNLVNVNSRYIIGFHCLERDAKLYEKSGIKTGNISRSHNYATITAAVLGLTEADRNCAGEINIECDPERAAKAGNRHLRKEKWYELVFTNLKNAENSVIKDFRNTVAHLNAIRNINVNVEGIAFVENYFALYHYIIQKHLQGVDHKKSTTLKYLSDLDRYHTYSKDFVKAYCVPMAYNLVRYKNLSIDGLFDRNTPPVQPFSISIHR